MKINTITLNHFRGATKSTTIKFNPKKSFVLIYGENGTGKSTLVDSLDCLFNKRQDTSFVSVNSAGAAPEVKITDETKTEYSLNNQLPNIIAILRRSFMSNLCHRRPADLYDFFQEFLEVSNFQTSEKNLETVTKNLQKQSENLLNIKAATILAIEDYYKEHVCSTSETPFIDAQEYVKQEMKDKIDTVKELDSLLKLHTTFGTLINQRNENLNFIKEIKYEINEISKKLDVRITSLLNLLNEASKIIQEDNTTPAVCPVCKQPIVKEAVISSIKKRLEDIKEAKSLNTRKKDLELELKKFEGAVSSIEKQIRDTIKKPLLTPHVPECAFNISSDLEIEDAITCFRTWEKQYIAIIKQKFDKLRSSLEIYINLKTNVEKIYDIESKLKNVNCQKEKSLYLYNLCKQIRQSHVQNMLEQLNQDICTFYDQMHSGEGISKLKLEVKENRNKSVELLAEFYGKQNIQPKNYYSEAHLDSLGLAIFLAVAKAQQKDILVLDDILTSLDLKHLKGILQLLTQLLKDGIFKQIILTTHYERLWSDCKYRGDGYYDVIKLNPWELTTGIFPLNNFSMLLDDLKTAINDPLINKNELALKAGLQLDAVSNLLCETYNLPLPYGKKGYTLGDYLNAIAKLKKQLKVITSDGKEQLLENIITKCDAYDWIRNEYAHINLNAEVSEDEVKNFALDVQTFSDALFCEKCRTYITKHDKTTGTRSCPSHCKKLEPVEFR